MTSRKATRALIYHPSERAVYLGRRSNHDKASPGKWALLGGKIDAGESPETAVMREVLEEAGVEFVPENTFLVHDNDDWETHFISGTIIGEHMLDPDEHGDGKYLTESDLNNHDLAFDHETIIIDFLRSLR